MVRTWLVIGSSEHWETAFAQPIPLWGLRESFLKSFQILSRGDKIAIYIITPIKGVIGFGSIKDKYIDRETLIWNEEKARGEVIWPLRFRISDIQALPRQYWKAKKGSNLPAPVDITDFPIFWQKGFHQLSDSQAAKVFERARGSWGDEIFRSEVRERVAEYGAEKNRIGGRR